MRGKQKAIQLEDLAHFIEKRNSSKSGGNENKRQLMDELCDGRGLHWKLKNDILSSLHAAGTSREQKKNPSIFLMLKKAHLYKKGIQRPLCFLLLLLVIFLDFRLVFNQKNRAKI
jgi:hypothetical protein